MRIKRSLQLQSIWRVNIFKSFQLLPKIDVPEVLEVLVKNEILSNNKNAVGKVTKEE